MPFSRATLIVPLLDGVHDAAGHRCAAVRVPAGKVVFPGGGQGQLAFLQFQRALDGQLPPVLTDGLAAAGFRRPLVDLPLGPVEFQLVGVRIIAVFAPGEGPLIGDGIVDVLDGRVALDVDGKIVPILGGAVQGYGKALFKGQAFHLLAEGLVHAAGQHRRNLGLEGLGLFGGQLGQPHPFALAHVFDRVVGFLFLGIGLDRVRQLAVAGFRLGQGRVQVKGTAGQRVRAFFCRFSGLVLREERVQRVLGGGQLPVGQ